MCSTHSEPDSVEFECLQSSSSALTSFNLRLYLYTYTYQSRYSRRYLASNDCCFSLTILQMGNRAIFDYLNDLDDFFLLLSEECRLLQSGIHFINGHRWCRCFGVIIVFNGIRIDPFAWRNNSTLGLVVNRDIGSLMFHEDCCQRIA